RARTSPPGGPPAGSQVWAPAPGASGQMRERSAATRCIRLESNRRRWWTRPMNMRQFGPRIGAALLLAAGGGCGSGTGSERVPPGLWGGEHVSMQVTVSDATLQFDCAHGYIGERIRLDAEGRFSVAGVFVREHGGPIGPGAPEDRFAAR